MQSICIRWRTLDRFSRGVGTYTITLLLVFALSPATIVPAQEENGGTALLLGVRLQAGNPDRPADTSENRESIYRTYLWIDGGPERRSFVGERNGLLVPRGQTLWLVDVRRSVYNEWMEDVLHAAPLGSPSRRSGIQSYNGEFCRGTRTLRILFAGSDYLGVDQRTNGYCEDAAHPWHSATLAMIPIDSTSHTGLPAARVLKKQGEDALRAAARRFLEQLDGSDGEFARYAAPDVVNWSAVRARGRWALLGRLDSDEAAVSQTADYPIRMEPSPVLVGQSAIPLPWERIRAVAPDAIDAVISPRGDLLLVLHPNRFTVHSLDADRLGPMRTEWPLPVAASALVMTQQGTETDAARWRTAFEHSAVVDVLGWRSVSP